MVIRVGDLRISLDEKESSANLNFVSHAHSDHTGGVKKNSKILCSEITRDLVQTRTSFKLNTVDAPQSIKLLNSGHMFGSKQLYIDCSEVGSIVYTGDYQMQKSPVAKEIEILEADTLIMDSTYPFPDVTFDDKDEVITAMQHYIIDRTRIGSVLFGAYSMGKAQELIKICNEIGMTPLVDKKIDEISKVYCTHGMRLDIESMGNFDDINDKTFQAPVWIVSMHKLDVVKAKVSSINRKIFTAVASGFAVTRKFNTDVQFALSDHADFKQALEYIERCSPKKIYTRGFGKEQFAANLKAYGYDASPLENMAQAGLLANYV